MKKWIALFLALILVLPNVSAVYSATSRSFVLAMDEPAPGRINTRVKIAGSQSTDGDYYKTQYDANNESTYKFVVTDVVTASGLISPSKLPNGTQNPVVKYWLYSTIVKLTKYEDGRLDCDDYTNPIAQVTTEVYSDQNGNMVDADGNSTIEVTFPETAFDRNGYYLVTQSLSSVDTFKYQNKNGYWQHNIDHKNPSDKNQIFAVIDPQDPNGGVTQNFPPGNQYFQKPHSVITSVVSNGGAFRSDKNTPISFEINDHSDPSITVTDTITASGLVPNQEYRVTAEIYEVPAMAMLSIREVLKEHFYPGSPVATKVVTLIADSSGNIPATKIIFDSRYYSGKQSVYHPFLQTMQYLDFRHYLVTQTLESVNKFDFGSGLETHRVEHTNKDNMLQVFVVKDTRFYSDPTPPPQPPQPTVINKPSDSKIVTVVSSGTYSASPSAALVLKAEQGKKNGDMVWVSVTDRVEAKNFLDMDTLYKITTRVMKKNTDGSVTEVKKIDFEEPSKYTTGPTPIIGRKNFDVEVDISGKYVVGAEYVVYQEMSVELESGLVFDDGTTMHKVVHEDSQNLSQSFRIVETPAPPVNTNPQPQPIDPQPQPSDGNSNQPEPQPTSPSSESVVTSSPSVAETSAETTTTTEVVPVQTAEGTTTTAVTTETATTETVTTTAVAVITTTESVTTRTTAEIPTTERIFEFIDIFEDIPLAVRTTAPLDLEEILIEESVPLGGLPHTGNYMTELYIGFGLFIASIGVLLKKRV